MKRLALLGASGHGKVVAEIALASGWLEVEFFDDAWPALATVGRWTVVGNTLDLIAGRARFDGVLVSIGNCNIRWAKQQLLADAGFAMISLTHPRSVMSPDCVLGQGSVVMAGAVINIDSHLGDGCIINTGSTIDHDCALGNAVHVAPGAHLAGNVTVGPHTWIGAGAVVRQGQRIGANVMVGAGAVVVDDLPDGVTVMGNPATVRMARVSSRT